MRSGLGLVLIAACGQAARPPAPVTPPPAPAPAPPPKVVNWYCFTAEPFNAECVRDQVSCNADALDMKERAKSVSSCQPAENVFCHQYADDPNAGPLCYPTVEYCENGRKIMEDSGQQSECVATIGGLVPPMKVSKQLASSTGGQGQAWWCFTTEHPYNAECVKEQPHCQRDGADMRGYSGAEVTECFRTETVYCHHYKGSDDPDPLCYPTPAHCDNGRKLMGEDSQTDCVRKGR